MASKKGCFQAFECCTDSECLYRQKHPEFKDAGLATHDCMSVNCPILKKYETEKCSECFFTGDCSFEAKMSKRDAK